MDETIRRWLLATLGPATDTTDLASRYTRLQSARAVALEVLRERLAALLAQPLKVTVSGVVSIDNSGNAAALERAITDLEDPTTPVPGEGPDDGSARSAVIYLHERPRR
ncbi:hypothetical protein [Streptomyces sp. NPDC001404]|uniref:hypothetical protein n=1 Tax=Streptomyces sp. NPDC001404 TaxID=3364571 RepID=UPI00368BDA10